MTSTRTLGDHDHPTALRPLRPAERAVLDALRRRPGQSRAMLAADLGLSPASMSAVVGRFLSDGWITEKRVHRPARRGQPALHLRLRDGALAGLGLSLSTGGIRAASVDASGRILDLVESPVGADDAARGLAEAREAVDHLTASAEGFAGIGIWAPAMIGREGQILEVTPTQSGVDYAAFARMLEDRYALPVILESKAPAIDEAMHGAATDAVVFMLFLDYGVGGSLIDGLRVYRGGFGQAVNIGALVPDSGPRPSLPDLARHLGLTGSEPPPRMLEALIAADDPRLADWIESRAAALSPALATVVQLFNPTDIVVGGQFPPEILARLLARITLDRHDMPGRLAVRKPRLRLARVVGENAMAVSAASVALHRILAPPEAGVPAR